MEIALIVTVYIALIIQGLTLAFGWHNFYWIVILSLVMMFIWIFALTTCAHRADQRYHNSNEGE